MDTMILLEMATGFTAWAIAEVVQKLFGEIEQGASEHGSMLPFFIRALYRFTVLKRTARARSLYPIKV